MDPYSDDVFMPAPKRRQPTASLGLFPPKFCLLRGHPPSPLNPGNIANLHKKTRDIMPEWIEGLKLRCATNLDVHKTLCMEWLMGNSTPTGFRFGGMICRKDNDNITVSNYVRIVKCAELITIILVKYSDMERVNKFLFLFIFSTDNSSNIWRYESINTGDQLSCTALSCASN
jgi:hypothetical protein